MNEGYNSLLKKKKEIYSIGHLKSNPTIFELRITQQGTIYTRLIIGVTEFV